MSWSRSVVLLSIYSRSGHLLVLFCPQNSASLPHTSAKSSTADTAGTCLLHTPPHKVFPISNFLPDIKVVLSKISPIINEKGDLGPFCREQFNGVSGATRPLVTLPLLVTPPTLSPTRSSAEATAVRSPPTFVSCFCIGPNCPYGLWSPSVGGGTGGPGHPNFVWTTKWPPNRNC